MPHAAAALPAAIAAANRESWAAVNAARPQKPAEAAPPPLPDLPRAVVGHQVGQQPQPGVQQKPQQGLQAKQQATAAVDDEDYDELFDDL